MKNSVLPIAVLLAVPVHAADMTAVSQTWTREAAEVAAAFAVPPVTVTLQKEYSQGDLLHLAFSEPLVGGEWPSTIAVTEDGYTFTIGILSSDEMGATYRVTELTAEGTDDLSTVGADFVVEPSDLTYFEVDGDALRASETLTLSLTSETAGTGLELETGALEDSLFVFSDQYPDNPSTTPLNFAQDIDVEPGVGIATRSVFTAPSPWGYGIGVSNPIAAANAYPLNFCEVGASNATYKADTIKTVVSLNGDWSNIETDVNGETEAIFGWNCDFIANPAVLSSDKQTAVIEIDGNAGSNTPGFGMIIDNGANGDGENPMLPTSVTTGYVLHYAPVTGTLNTGLSFATDYETQTLLDGHDTGALGINGSVVKVYAVPAGDAVEPFIWITNSNVSDAPVSVTAITEQGDSVELGQLAVAAGNGITRLSSELSEALSAAGIVSGRVTLEVTTSAPACDVNIAASYKVVADADRLKLETSQTLQGTHNTGNSGSADDLCAPATGGGVAPTSFSGPTADKPPRAAF